MVLNDKILITEVRVCKCSCGCKLTSKEVHFDEKELCIFCDKGNRDEYPDKLGLHLLKMRRHLTGVPSPNIDYKMLRSFR